MKHDLGGGLALFHPKRKETCIGHLAFTARTVPYSILVFFHCLSPASFCELPVLVCEQTGIYQSLLSE